MEVRGRVPRLGNMLSICLFFKHVRLSVLISFVLMKNEYTYSIMQFVDDFWKS